MHLSHLTVTGADDATDVSALAALSHEAPLLEWGVLMSAAPAGGPRFPTPAWRDRFADAAPAARRAAHVCGQALLERLRQPADPAAIELRRAAGGQARYGRVQLNFDAQALPVAVLARTIDDWCRGRWVRDDGTAIELVTQHNAGNAAVHAMFDGARGSAGYPAWYAVLFDESGGEGFLPRRWPWPLPGLRCGYAGGLNARNIADQLRELADLVPDEATIWVDMESGVRTGDRFDIGRVREVLAAVRSLAGGAPLVPGVHIGSRRPT